MGRHHRVGWMLALALACTTALAVPVSPAGASTRFGKSAAPMIKIGMLAPITSPTAANPDQGEAFKAAVAAFNKRGGVGKNGTKMEAVVCDTKGDANGEVGCARTLANAGVVATVSDLAYNNPSGVQEVLAAAGIPRIGLVSAAVWRHTCPSRWLPARERDPSD